MDDYLPPLAAIAFILVFGVSTWAFAHSTIAMECEKLGAFYVADKVYECKRKELK